ncbi:MAG: serine hydrolase [Clostridia bacterium]|nr:serine hydrolase [Clostridia bacterium]
MPIEIAGYPEEAGVSSASVLAFLNALDASGMELHALTVLRHGKQALCASFAPYSAQEPHVLYSVSKSFTSAAVGFAVEEGLLSYDSRVLDILADDAPENPDEWLKTVTLHHLLCMGSGLRQESDRISHIAGEGQEEDWAKAVLAFGCDAEPGTCFRYNSHGTYLVSCMVQKVTGMNIRDYLMPRLFEPLGISKPKWEMSPQGVCCGGWGLYLSCEELSRFGQCLLDGGMWQGRQLLPRAWIDAATRAQIDNANRTPAPTIEWAQGYGYQFWRCTQDRYRGDGMYGQLLIIDHKRDMVIAVNAHTEDMAAEMALVTDYLAPAAGARPGTKEEQQMLKKRLETLAVKA